MSPQKVHIWCIVGAGISFSVFGSRSLHQHTTTTNAKGFKRCNLQLNISFSNGQVEPSKSSLKATGTKWHHPHPHGTAISRVEASNFEQLSSQFALLPQWPPVNVPLVHLLTENSRAAISNSQDLPSSLPSLPFVQASLPVFISQNTLTQANPNTAKRIENLNPKMSSLPCSSFPLFPLLPPLNIPLFHSRQLALIGGFPPDRTDFTSPKKVYFRCIVDALYPRAAKSTFGLLSMNPTNPASCDTYASIHAYVLPTNLAKNPGCTNSAPPPSSRHQDRTAHLSTMTRVEREDLLPGGSVPVLPIPEGMPKVARPVHCRVHRQQEFPVPMGRLKQIRRAICTHPPLRVTTIRDHLIAKQPSMLGDIIVPGLGSRIRPGCRRKRPGFVPFAPFLSGFSTLIPTA
jgi:hypothetical protein